MTSTLFQTIVEWLLAHAHELFSGIGATALVASATLFLGWVKKRRSSKRRIDIARMRATDRPVPAASGHGPLDPSALTAWQAFGEVPHVSDPRVPSRRQPQVCNFCRRSATGGRKIFSGPGVNICNECLDVGLTQVDQSGDRVQLVMQLQRLTFERENPDIDHFAKESLRAEIDRLAAALRRRRREGPGDTIAGAELIRTVGAGNFGSVWEARKQHVSPAQVRRVAVKIFDQDKLSLGLMLWRFQRGLRAMKHFRDLGKKTPKQIVELIDIEADHLSFSMPFLPGGDLQQLRSRHLPLDRRLVLFDQVCKGTAFAHEQGIIHRDIKPANIVLDDHGDAVLTDFDISDITFARTQSVVVGGLGTPEFAAPEQLLAMGLDAQPSCDVFSLGKLLYFLVTEQAPPLGWTDGTDYPSYLEEIKDGRHRRVIHAAIQGAPARRPQSVASLMRLLA